MYPDIEYKTSSFEVKDVDEAKGVIAGYASHYGNVDDGGDVIEHGAGAKTLQERKGRIKALYGHDFGKLIGHPIEIKEDDNGLYTVTKLAIKSFWGNEVYSLALNGSLNEMSIGYAAMQGATTRDPDTGVRRIGEYKLYEYSFVPLAMNAQARVTAVKALNIGNPGEVGEYVEALARKWESEGKLTDEIKAALAAISAVVTPVAPPDAKAAETRDVLTPDERAAMLRRIDLARRTVGRTLVGV